MALRQIPHARTRAGSDKYDPLIRTIYATCLLAGTYTHATALLRHGLFWDYGGYWWPTVLFWTSLTFLDPAAAICLFLRPRLGLILVVAIMAADVAHNWGAVIYGLMETDRRHQHWDYAALAAQTAFLCFVLLTIRIPWARLERAESS